MEAGLQAVQSWASPSRIVLLALAAWILHTVWVGFRRYEAWKFFFYGREMIRDQAKLVSPRR